MDMTDRVDISLSARDLINLAAIQAAAEAFGAGMENPGSGIVGDITLRTIVVVGINRLGLIIPGGQPVYPVLGLTPYLMMLGFGENQEDEASDERPPTDTPKPTETPKPTDERSTEESKPTDEGWKGTAVHTAYPSPDLPDPTKEEKPTPTETPVPKKKD